ncbi:MAG: SUMF1/EgtB/PvdO family nonheme iron enzyme, partial [Pirellulaceae bacterium]|nr:SUMF1/EgtB/PvdO family nonheme iron enzyme [Pirellulaceae bacterium]
IEGFREDDHAVAGVNYMDAAAFCEWLSKKEGRRYRLPEVYEWEYACRAGTDTLFHWGNRADPRYMNYAGSRIGHPTPVGFYPPNSWGFYDMHGSVAECCAQIGRPGGVQKGGAWNYPATLLGADVYVDVRGTFIPHMPIKRRTMGTGFRIACDASEAKARSGDLPKPTILPAAGTGPEVGQLDIQVGEKMDLGKVGGGGVKFLVTQSGRWILNGKRSDDQGKTWQPCENIRSNTLQLRDGTIISVHGPNDMPTGHGTIHVRTSTDDWQTVESFSAPIDIPGAKRFWSQPTGMLELDDGSLLLPLYGWMHGDQVREDNPMFPIADEAYKTRVILTKSTDRGRNWNFLSTICYHPEMGREGANETTIIQLPTGDLFAAMRTGLHGYFDRHGREELDEPLLVSWSRCEGKKWAEPARIYVGDKLVTGIWPEAVLTEENVLAVFRGRPYGSVVFNPDGSGTTWTDEVAYEYSDSSTPTGMDAMALIGPYTVLVTYIDHFDWAGDITSTVIGLPITVRKRK